MNEHYYIGEIILWSGFRIPAGCLICDGSIKNIAEYQTLFSVVGTTFGGNGTTTFGLPNLKGRVPIGKGQGQGLSNRVLGSSGGINQVPLTVDNLPAHTHMVFCENTVNSTSPLNAIWGKCEGRDAAYSSNITNPQNFAANAISPSTGGPGLHNNMQPYTALNYIICAEGGTFPVPS